jgi:hypothetical protein
VRERRMRKASDITNYVILRERESDDCFGYTVINMKKEQGDGNKYSRA